jgi:predicted nucleotidyltransferase
VTVDQSVDAALPEIAALCERLGVVRLDLFGSATGSSFDPRSSDIDVLVEFGSGVGPFDAYFSLKEGLERILDRPVDVVSASSIRNPYFLEQIRRERERLYAA